MNVPHVDSVEDACRAVQTAKYAPLGRRGCATCSRSTGQGTRRLDAAAMRQKNEETMLMVQIESPGRPQRRRDRGRRRNRSALRRPGRFGARLRRAARPSEAARGLAAVGRAIRAAGKNCGLIVSDPSKLAACRQLGFDLICCGLDTMIFRNAAESLLARFRDGGTVRFSRPRKCGAPPRRQTGRRDEDLSRLRSQRPAARHSQRCAGRFRRPLLQSLVEGYRRPARRLLRPDAQAWCRQFRSRPCPLPPSIAGVTTHPNVAAVVFVSSGNEDHPPEEVLADADRAGVPCRIVSIKDCKDGGALIRRGRRLAEQLVNQARRARRVAIGIDHSGSG